ncbi:MAG: hypothetical protein K0V04_30665 [Deltaproteobacteria bacterium]|nr:hypothetical protein [Deltaproteobacteria bacterium]
MKTYPGVFLGLGACCLLVALDACDREELEHDDDDFTQQFRAVVGNDHNFECTVDEGDLEPWEPDGMDVPADVQAKFGLWTTMNSSCVPTTLTDNCDVPPPRDHSPIKAPGAGGVRRGDIVVAKEDVKVYRAFSAESFACGAKKPGGPLGGWWTLSKPAPPKQEYRESFAICPAWNDLSMINTCTLAAGTVVLVGPTQSASCMGTSTCDPAPPGWEDTLPPPGARTDAAQVFINTFAGSHKRTPQELGKFLLDCTAEPWED